MRAVPREAAEQFRDQNRMIGYVETSAKDNNNIEDAFVAIARVISFILFNFLIKISIWELFWFFLIQSTRY